MAAYTEVTVRPSPPLVQPSCLQREASGKLISAAERGVLQQVIVILALGADVDTRGEVRAAAGVCFISPQLSVWKRSILMVAPVENLKQLPPRAHFSLHP